MHSTWGEDSWVSQASWECVNLNIPWSLGHRFCPELFGTTGPGEVGYLTSGPGEGEPGKGSGWGGA